MPNKDKLKQNTSFDARGSFGYTYVFKAFVAANLEISPAVKCPIFDDRNYPMI
jgi:hypothetical protein